MLRRILGRIGFALVGLDPPRCITCGHPMDFFCTNHGKCFRAAFPIATRVTPNEGDNRDAGASEAAPDKPNPPTPPQAQDGDGLADVIEKTQREADAWRKTPGEATNCISVAAALEVCISRLRSLATNPPSQTQDGWQPIEIAPKDEYVIVGWNYAAYSDRRRCEAIFDGNRWWAGDFDFKFTPTHWMPLPAPPTIEGGE